VLTVPVTALLLLELTVREAQVVLSSRAEAASWMAASWI
jgi:hypothetical protein